jgi:hypothetical protein
MQTTTVMQARLAYSMDIFLKEGRVPGVLEGNKNEPLVPIGKAWNGYGQVKLGASLEAACESPGHLSASVKAFPPSSPYLLTYRPDKDKVYVVLRESADEAAALEGAFVAHLWLERIHEAVPERCRRNLCALPSAGGASSEAEDTLAYARAHWSELWHDFKHQAVSQGWKLGSTMLAIGDTRLINLP